MWLFHPKNEGLDCHSEDVSIQRPSFYETQQFLHILGEYISHNVKKMIWNYVQFPPQKKKKDLDWLPFTSYMHSICICCKLMCLLSTYIVAPNIYVFMRLLHRWICFMDIISSLLYLLINQILYTISHSLVNFFCYYFLIKIACYFMPYFPPMQ